MNIKRKVTKAVKIGNVIIGSGYPIAIQSMTKTDTSDVVRTVKQIRLAQEQGCQIIRVAVKEERAAQAIKKIKQAVDIPIVADIHFDYRLALKAISYGADKIRLNPGNIYKEKEIAQVVSLAKERNIPIRVGVNSGSLRTKSKDNANALVKSALDYIKLLEHHRFRNIVISLKSSSVTETVQANRKISSLVDYPLHLGVTATGLADIGFVKSAICLGLLLSQGIGDTIRVSLTAHPCQEVIAAKKILAALDIDNPIDIIACPTCGRCEVDLVGIVQQIESELKVLKLKSNPKAQPLKVAIMGCVVNGPGEARCADLGIAFGKGFGLFFKNGKPVRKINQKQAANFLVGQIKKRLVNIKAS
jgi:(E)-4-hydroxy-3-methylbut-2-enyl-diphosphate synthase